MKQMAHRLASAFLFLIMGATVAQAADIPFASWHLDTDDCGGFRQSTYEPTVYFAVAQSTVWDPTATYLAPTGFHVASTAEALAIFGTNGQGGPFVYHGQCGWTGYDWEGGYRTHFRFSDSASTNGYKHIGHTDAYQILFNYSGTTEFGGMMLIQSDPTPVDLTNWGTLKVRFSHTEHTDENR